MRDQCKTAEQYKAGWGGGAWRGLEEEEEEEEEEEVGGDGGTGGGQRCLWARTLVTIFSWQA